MILKTCVKACCLFLLLPVIVFCFPLKEIHVHGNKNLKKEEIVNACGLKEGTQITPEKMAYAVKSLLYTGCFDTAYVKEVVLEDSTVALHFVVQEKDKSDLFIYGGTLGTSMFGEPKIWLSAMPGYKRRFLFHRMQTFRATVTLPYVYGVSCGWLSYGLPFKKSFAGFSLSARSSPYVNAKYLSNKMYTSIFLDREFFPSIYFRLSLSDEVGKIYRIDTDKWKRKRWHIIMTDPGNYRDTDYDIWYPRSEHVPSIGLSARLDKRNSFFYPTKGYFLFAEGRHYRIYNLNSDYRFSYNQATGLAQKYIAVNRKQTIASQFKFIARDRFDPFNLAHRLIAYNDDYHFRGFASLFGTNIAFVNLEYRFRLFEVKYKDLGLELNLDKRIEKLFNKLDYLADIFLFLDNGLFWGDVYFGGWDRITRDSFGISEDLFTGMGLGARLVYPKLGYIASGGIMYQRKINLHDDYKPLFYGSLSASF
jgi:outer membrane protein assembly factor BamA